MAMTARRLVLGAAMCSALVVFGISCGMLVDRIRFDRQREAVLKPYRDALKQRNQDRMKLELSTRGRHPDFAREWARTLARIDDALQAGDSGAAVTAWRDAYREAVRSGRWEPMLDVAEAALQIGDVPELPPTSRAIARRGYLAAFFRARAERSIDGVLRICEGFTILGDRDVVEHCVRTGHALSETDADGRRRVVAFAQRFVSTARAVGQSEF